MYIDNAITPVKTMVLSRTSLETLMLRLFRNGEQGAWIDPSDASTLFQDAAGTTPAGIGDPVRLALDKSGNDNHALAPSDAARPVLGRVPVTGKRNLIPNNRLDGAAVGVVGSGGSLPTGWSVTSAFDSVEILEISERDGFPLLRIRLIADNTGGSGAIFPRLRPQPITNVGYNANETWTASLFSEEIARTGVAAPFRLIAGTNVGPFVAELANASIPTSYQRISATGSTSNASAETIRVEIGPNLAVGEAIDITLEIAVPQLEKSATATAVQITGAGGFDVTEAGVRSLYYLQSDGVDDILEFPSGTIVYGPSEVWLGYRYEAGTTFVAGFRNFGTGGGQNRFQVTHSSNNFGAMSTTIEPRVTGDDYVIGGSVVGTGTTTQTAFRLGSTPVTEAVTRAGTQADLQLFGAFTSFAQMRFYGGLVIDRVLTEKERDTVQRYLARKSGVTYP